MEKNISDSNIGTCYDYIYYVAYKLENKILSKRSMYSPSTVASYLMALTEGFYLLFIYKIFFEKYVFTDGDNSKAAHLVIIAIAAILVLYNLKRFEKNDRYLEIIKKYTEEELKNKIVGRIIVGFIFILPWVMYGYMVFTHK